MDAHTQAMANLRRECFVWYDKNGDGYVQGQDIPLMLRAMGQIWTNSELKQLPIECSSSGVSVDFETFDKMCNLHAGQRPNINELQKAFEVFDRENTGEILIEELMHILASVGEPIPKEDFKELCGLAGIAHKDENRSIDFEQFISIFAGSLELN